MPYRGRYVLQLGGVMSGALYLGGVMTGYRWYSAYLTLRDGDFNAPFQFCWSGNPKSRSQHLLVI